MAATMTVAEVKALRKTHVNRVAAHHLAKHSVIEWRNNLLVRLARAWPDETYASWALAFGISRGTVSDVLLAAKAKEGR